MRYSANQKTQIVLEILKEEMSVAQIASEYEGHPNQLNRWKKQALEGLPKLFKGDRKADSNRVYVTAISGLREAIQANRDYVTTETLTVELSFSEPVPSSAMVEDELEGEKVTIGLLIRAYNLER